MKNTRHRTVKGKITRHVVVALVLTVAVLTIINVVFLSRQIIKQQEAKLELATQMSSNTVDSWINDMGTVTEDIASSLVALGDLNTSTVKAVVDRVALNHPELYFVYFADYRGVMTMARGVEYASGVDPRNRDWYKKAVEAGHTVVIDPYASATRPDIMLASVVTPVYWGSTLVGVVGVDADIETIQQFMRDVDFESGSYGFLLDSQDNVIVHPNEDFNPSADSVTYALEVMPELESVIHKDNDDVVTTVDYSGEEMVYSAVTSEISNWTVVVAYPSKNVWGTVRRGVAMSMFIALVFIIIAIIDIAYTVRKILKPIDNINPVMDKIIAGDFTSKMDFETSDDEIGELQNKLAQSIGGLTDIIEEQKYVLGEMEKGNLAVADVKEAPGELNDIALAVNSIKEKLNDMISDIQFSALNLQSFAMGINETSDLDEMRMVFEELSAEANELMEKTSVFITLPPSGGVDTEALSASPEDEIES